MVDVPVSGRVLKWARMERRLTVDAAAKLLKISVDDLLQLESEAMQPTLGLLRRMATKYQIQLASLLMPEPLSASARPAIHDFRTVQGRDATFTMDLVLAIEQMAEQAEAFGDLREASPNKYLAPDVPHYHRNQSPREVAARERLRLGITVEEQLSWEKDRTSFLRWRNVIEGLGVHVQLMKLGDIDDVRGVSNWDERGVAIVVINNDDDDYRFRNFSLLHEYCHVLLRMCGVSDQNRTSRIERYCNQFAAFFLMPPREFKEVASAIHKEGRRWTEFHVNRLATQFRVSKSAVAIHLEDTGLVARGFYNEMNKEWRKRKRRPSTGGQATPTEKRANRLGGKTVDVVMGAIEAGDLNKVDAYEILDVRPKDFPDLMLELRGRKAEYGGAA